MNIFIFCGPLAFGKGGMEKVAANLANFLALRNGFKITLGYFKRDAESAPAYYVCDKVTLSPWHLQAKKGRQKFIKRICESKPDLFIYFGASVQVLKVLSLIDGSEIPVIIHEGSNPERVITTNWADVRNISRYEAAWERELVLSQASVIRFTMSEYADSVSLGLRDKVNAFPNAFDQVEERANVAINKNIINIGGLKANKNIIPLLEALRLLFKEFPDWHLHIFSAVNNNPEGLKFLESVKKKVDFCGMRENVVIHGEVDDLGSYYLNSSIHVITSLSEGLSNAVAESMCHGVPTVGVKGVPGVDGVVVDNVNGFLVEPNSLVEGLYESLKRLIKDSNLRDAMGRNAFEKAKIFDPDKVYECWLDIIEKAVSLKSSVDVETVKQSRYMLRELYCQNVKDYDFDEKGYSFYAKKLEFLKGKVDERTLLEKESHAIKNRWVSF
ncbi:glycosyltransferase family 4 protein [Halomonas sp. ATBC28]|uniref:glycosyltransferase n=1 Tax=Halomonas sp. ATBC28 TaxID=2545264 RepID=UPI00110D6329|nr:glycosyltransferase [Halomonas sp. ATBC28]TMU23209.1 glycosyltransferase family 4 protein [Halomonas sp. ATBC28]